MAEKELQQIVEHAVAQVLERQLPKLQAALVERVLDSEMHARKAVGTGNVAANAGVETRV